MTNTKLDILCLRGQDEITNNIKQSDLIILKDELGHRKVEINIIQNINDLCLKNPIYIHLLTDCYKDYNAWGDFIHQYKLNKNKNPSLPSINMNDIDSYTNIDILVRVRKFNIPSVKLLEMGIITHVLSRDDMTELIKKFMKDRKVTKACIRFAYGHCPSFLVDLNDDNSFAIDYGKYAGHRLSLSNIIIHPIKSEKTYMKGVISIIYIDDKYSHAVIKKPYNTNSGIRNYSVSRYSPSYRLLNMSRLIVSKINSTGKFPVIQINFCHSDDITCEYLLTNVNYIDPKLYLKVNKKPVKKISKMIIQMLKDHK